MKNSSDIFKIIKASIMKFIWTLGFNAFYTLIFIIIAEIFLGGFIFHKFIFFVDKKTAIINTTDIVKLDTKGLFEIDKKIKEL